MEITIPTKWSDITIQDYIKLRPVLSEENSNEATRIINILCLLSNKKRQEIEQLSIPQYSDLVSKMHFLKEPIPEKIKSNIVKVNKEHYVFSLDPNNILFGEYISVMDILEKAKDNPEMIYDNMHNLLTVICKPIKKRWWGYKVKPITNKVVQDTAKNFYENMPITDAQPIAVFFYQNLPSLMKTIRTFMLQMAETEMKKTRKILKKQKTVGVG